MSKILIVEDEVAIAELEKDYLELSGFEVKDIVSKAEKITSGKNTTMPVLSSVYFKVRSGNLTATCFDTKSGYVYTHPQQVNCEDVGMVVPLKEFSSLVKNFNNNDTISLTKEGSKVGIKNSFADFTISLLNEEEYPEITIDDIKKITNLSLGTVKECVEYWTDNGILQSEEANTPVKTEMQISTVDKVKMPLPEIQFTNPNQAEIEKIREQIQNKE